MSLDLQQVSNSYFDKLFSSNSGSSLPGAQAKVLLLDDKTTSAVSVCWSQSALLAKDVVLVDTINRRTELSNMQHLQCIVYVSIDSLDRVCAELEAPHFGSYSLFFNNVLTKQQVENLAQADSQEKVTSVIEIFQDYLAINSRLFLGNLSPVFQGGAHGRSGKFVEEAGSLASLLLSVKQCPIVKYEQGSSDLRRLASEILYSINSNSNNSLFDELNKKRDIPPVLLLLDRKNDPLTPLLSPWTYQAMIHELIGINKNVVTIEGEQMTLSESDDFFKEAMYLNYGDLTDKVQKYVEQYKKKTKNSVQTNNLSELKRFLVQFPEFKKFSSNVSKHLNIVSEIDRKINQSRLWEVGELQQIIVGDLESKQSVKTRIIDILTNNGGKPPVSTHLKVKLVLIYALSNDKPDDLPIFINMLSDPQLCNPIATTTQLALLRSYHKYLPIKQTNETPQGLKKLSSLFKNEASNPQADNIYMQHIPTLSTTLSNLITPAQQQQQSDGFTSLVPEAVTKQYGTSTDLPHEVIVYIHGGVTYEEARLVHELNESQKLKVIIGGEQILNSDMWLSKLEDMVTDGEINKSQELPNRREQLRDIL